MKTAMKTATKTATDRLPTRKGTNITENADPRARQPCLTMVLGPIPGRLFRLKAGNSVLGRGDNADCVFDEPDVSRNHAAIHVNDRGEAMVTDNRSSNGTFVNGERVRSKLVGINDKIRLGANLVLRYDLYDDLDIAFTEHLFLSATTDALTGCRNRRFFDTELPRECAYAKRAGLPLSLALIDIDGFKDINDAFGHRAGDGLLQIVAEEIRSCVREYDSVARWGGDEFGVMLRDVAIDKATEIMRRIGSKLRGIRLDGVAAIIDVTLSIGMANTDHDQVHEAATLKHIADMRLYQAKRAGRDRVVARDVKFPSPEELAQDNEPPTRRETLTTADNANASRRLLTTTSKERT